MFTLFKIPQNKTQTFKRIGAIAIIALMFLIVSYGMGYIKGAGSCKKINANKARKNLETSQKASSKTAKYNIEQVKKATRLQNKRKQIAKENQDACINQIMPTSLIDTLNQ